MNRSGYVFFVLLTFSAGMADAQRLASDPPTAREAVILRALAQTARFKFTETPLEQVFDTIEKRHGILPLLDVKALNEIGIGTDTRVTIALNNVSLAQALDFMLYNLDPTLTWAIEKDVLIITTREAAEENLQTWIYDVTALVESNGPYDRDYDALIELISRSIEPDSWDEVGGPGSINEYETNGRSALVISQTFQIHRKIDNFLRTLYRFAGRSYPSSDPDMNSAAEGRNWTGVSRAGEIDNPRNLPLTKPRQSAEARAGGLPRRFYSASDRPAAVIYAGAK